MELTKKLAIKYIKTKLKVLSQLSKRKAAEKAFELFITPQARLRKAPSTTILKAETLTMHFDGLTIHGYRWNHQNSSEKKVLLLHGHESSAVNFDHFVAPLIKKDYEVFAFDAPAHGKSEGKMINAIDYKNFILAVMQQFGPISSFISHSFGGLALSLALEEVPHNESWKVVFIAPATESVRAIDNFFSHLQLDREVRKEFDDLITRANNKPPSWYSVARSAEHLKAQVLFLQDKQDYLTPMSDVEPIIARKYPNFRFIISDGLGHRKIYKDKSSVQVVTEFL
jgi:pimeloyl-ACP methyl ester carboxylesterase